PSTSVNQRNPSKGPSLIGPYPFAGFGTSPRARAVLVKGRAELGSGARVEGDITSPTLVIAEGAVFIGRSVMGGEATQSEETSLPVGGDSPPAPVGASSGSAGRHRP